ncbi:hypothetical protein BN1708_017477 [Verticillium longisporum]|uniref:Uncharacterized protein n=1 Tax=Verticillium longisporum TaxID=100787 RepID=A0A0G4L2U7_VERLO|nr:hypothetical protein BN1708_017477 [Verticillium longisporum]
MITSSTGLSTSTRRTPRLLPRLQEIRMRTTRPGLLVPRPELLVSRTSLKVPE